MIRAIDKLDWEMLKDEKTREFKSQENIEQTLKSFFSKRIKGRIRRRIDILRGNIRIPEHRLNEMRNTKDKKMVAMFFNSIFSISKYLIIMLIENFLIVLFFIYVIG